MGFPDSATLERCYWRQDTARWNPGLLPEFARPIRFSPSGLRFYRIEEGVFPGFLLCATPTYGNI